MPTNRERLIEIMERDGLTAEDIGAMVQASPSTVHAWLRPPHHAAHRNIGDRVLRILDLALGVRIVSDASKAADALGTTIGRVKELATASSIVVDGALWGDRSRGGKLMERIAAGEVVELRLGLARALACKDWAFLPVAVGSRSVLLSVPAVLRRTEDGDLSLDTQASEWSDECAARRAETAATRLNELNAEEARLEARIVGTSGREREGIEAALRANDAARQALAL